MKQKLIKVIYVIAGTLYFPIYMLSIVLHFVARLALAISYFGVLERKMGLDIIKSLFRLDGKY